jgi:hypothetical protein
MQFWGTPQNQNRRSYDHEPFHRTLRHDASAQFGKSLDSPKGKPLEDRNLTWRQ